MDPKTELIRINIVEAITSDPLLNRLNDLLSDVIENCTYQTVLHYSGTIETILPIEWFGPKNKIKELIDFRTQQIKSFYK